jgi:hypothetical protein
MVGDQLRIVRARWIIADAKRRSTLFASTLLNDRCWIILLQLFVVAAQNHFVSEQHLLMFIADCGEGSSECVTLLVDEGHLEPRQSGDIVLLTPTTMMRLREYLDIGGKALA